MEKKNWSPWGKKSRGGLTNKPQRDPLGKKEGPWHLKKGREDRGKRKNGSSEVGIRPFNWNVQNLRGEKN